MRIVNQDLLSVESGVIAHQVNCLGVMGAGVARQIAAKYPEVLTSYKKYVLDSRDPLGNCQLVQVADDLWVANIFGQRGVGSRKVQTDYGAVYTAFDQLRQQMGRHKLGNTVHVPFGIGCGLAGGDWKSYVQVMGFALGSIQIVACKI